MEESKQNEGYSSNNDGGGDDDNTNNSSNEKSNNLEAADERDDNLLNSTYIKSIEGNYAKSAREELRGWFACDRYKLEVCLRIALATCLSSTLSVAYIPNVVPPGIGFFVGFFGIIFSILTPHVVFAVLGFIPLLLFLILVQVFLSTIILAAYDIGVVSGSGVYQGTGNNDAFICVYSFMSLLMSAFFFGSCYTKTAGLIGLLFGLTSMFTLFYRDILDNANQNTAMEGYPITVADLWTNQGVDNKLAAFRNTLICWCWAFLCVCIGILVPPVNTARRLFSSVLLPGAMDKVAEYLVYEGKPSNDNELKRTIYTLLHELDGGVKPEMTRFEPRLWRTEDLVTPLAKLFQSMQTVLRVSLVRFAEEIPGGEPCHRANDVLRLCATALRSNNPLDQAALQEHQFVTDDDGFEGINSTNDDYIHSYWTMLMTERIKLLRGSTLNWLWHLNSSAQENRRRHKHNKTSFQEIARMRAHHNLKWIVDPMIPFCKRSAEILALPFQPSRWDIHSTLWGIKYAAGYILLFTLSVYYPNWCNLDLKGESSQKTYIEWQLVGYAVAWTSTAEGTVKKGLMRVIGTLLGGFLGWLGIITCKGSYEYSDGDRLNPYGIVAWLTFFTTFIAYLGTDTGPKAMFGHSCDHGYLIFYFAMVQALVMLQAQSSASYKRDALVANRVIDTIVGVALAAILAVVPPNVYGGCTKRLKNLLEDVENIFRSILNTAVLYEEQPCDLTTQREQLKKAHANYNEAVYLANDAGVLRILPFFRLDPRVIQIQDELLVILLFVERIEELLSKTRDDDNIPALKYCLQELRENEQQRKQQVSDNLSPLVSETFDGTRIIPGLAKRITRKLKELHFRVQKLSAKSK